MIRFCVKRLLMLIPIMLGISLIILILIYLTPGDPAKQALGQTAEPEQLEAFREVHGLNDSFFERYLRFVGGVVKGDLGTSFKNQRTVWSEIQQRFPYTLLIVSLSMLLSLFIGIPLGVFAATHQYSWKDNVAIFGSLFCVSMPSFWFALILVQVFAVQLRILPAAGIGSWQSWVLPTVSLALGYAAVIARQTRSSLLEVIRQDYITTARAKGQTERKVLYRHALKNALIPTIMMCGSIFGLSLSGALVTEVIFSIPGMGSYTLAGLQNRDYPVIQGSVLFLAVIFSLVILIIDIIFAFIDPRIRSQYAGKKTKQKKESS